MSFPFDLHSAAVSDSHLPCRAHAMLWPCRSSQGHSAAWPSRDDCAALWPWEERHAMLESAFSLMSVPVGPLGTSTVFAHFMGAFFCRIILSDGNIFWYSRAFARMLEHTTFFASVRLTRHDHPVLCRINLGLLFLNPLVAVDPSDVQNQFVLSAVFQRLR